MARKETPNIPIHPKSLRMEWGVIAEVVCSGTCQTIAGDTVALASNITYRIGINTSAGKPEILPAAAPHQARPNYKVYAARVGTPVQIYWYAGAQGRDEFSFQVIEAVYARECGTP